MSSRGPPDRKLVQHLSSVENVHRTLSLAIDLSTVYGRENLPNRLEMYKFVHKQIGVKAEELEDIQNHPFLPQVYVKVKTEATLIRMEDKMRNGVKVFGKNIVLYGWRCDIPLTTVRINGTNPDTLKERIVEVMSKYGEVTACDRGRIDYFKNHFVSDGTWVLRMKPEQGKGLPSIIYYTEGGNKDIWSVIFDGKISCCWKCGGEGHRGDQCRSARPKPAQQGQIAPVGIGTYCDVVKEGVQEEWKGMTVLNSQKQKQKPLLVVQQVHRKPVWPASLNNEWKSIPKMVGNWSELPRTPVAGHMTSMVGHRAPDVAMQLDNNRYSVLANRGDDGVQEMEQTKPGYIPFSNSRAVISKFRNKRKQLNKQAGRKVNIRLDSNSSAKEFRKNEAVDKSASESEEVDNGLDDITAMEFDIQNHSEAGVNGGEGLLLDNLEESLGLRNVENGGMIEERGLVAGVFEGESESIEIEEEVGDVQVEKDMENVGNVNELGVVTKGDMGEGGSQSHSQERVRLVGGIPVKSTGDSSRTKMQTGDPPSVSLLEIIHPLGSETSPVEKKQKQFLGQSQLNQDGCT